MAQDQTVRSGGLVDGVGVRDDTVATTSAGVLLDMFGPDAVAVAERQLDAATEEMKTVWSAVLAQLTVATDHR